VSTLQEIVITVIKFQSPLLGGGTEREQIVDGWLLVTQVVRKLANVMYTEGIEPCSPKSVFLSYEDSPYSST
jgi:hypothetical protein